MKSENYYNNPHTAELLHIGEYWEKQALLGVPLFPSCPVFCTKFKCWG